MRKIVVVTILLGLSISGCGTILYPEYHDNTKVIGPLYRFHDPEFNIVCYINKYNSAGVSCTKL